MNVVTLVGRLTADPDRKETGSGTTMTTFRLAVKREFAKDGQTDADFFRIVTFGKQAESVARYLAKGSWAAVNGRIQNETYTGKGGEKKNSVSIIADRVEFVGAKAEPRPQYDGFHEYQDDDVPF